jgi:hypothetical protein
LNRRYSADPPSPRSGEGGGEWIGMRLSRGKRRGKDRGGAGGGGWWWGRSASASDMRESLSKEPPSQIAGQQLSTYHSPKRTIGRSISFCFTGL